MAYGLLGGKMSEIKLESNLPIWVMVALLLIMYFVSIISAVMAGFGVSCLWMLNNTPKIEKIKEGGQI